VVTGRARLAASVLDSDLGNLAGSVRRCSRAGADRIHLDVMDGHFVPNLTFGAKTIKALRRVTEIPFDAHLMISNPGRYVDEFIDAGCDSITFHVEIDEPIEPTLDRIRAAGRAAGLAVKPKTPLAALGRYRTLLDIVLVMTVEPGFGGQSFMADVAEKKLLAAHDVLAEAPDGGEVHVDGGVNRQTAELVGANAADVLVVGSALFTKGREMAREIRIVKALADSGFRKAHPGAAPEPVREDENQVEERGSNVIELASYQGQSGR
jgi:ribulose-phosphate 3-epimerase